MIDKLFNIFYYYEILHNFLAKRFAKTALTFNRRQIIYRMLEKMTGEGTGIPIYEAIGELKIFEKKNNFKSRLWYFYDDLLIKMRSTSATFSTAIANYIPEHDVVILKSAELDDISYGFSILLEVNKNSKNMRKAFVNNLSYPIFLIFLLSLVLYFFSKKIIPEYSGIIPFDANISSYSKFLLKSSKNFDIWMPIFIVVIGSLLFFVSWALPNFINKNRKYLESLPPFNMYRIMIGCGFLFALNSLTKVGFQQLEALIQMSEVAKPYLKYRIEVIIGYMAEGNDIGNALIKSGLNFPDENMMKELSIHSKYSQQDNSLEVLSKSLAEDGLEVIQLQAKILNYVITTVIFGIIGFLYLGIYNLGQDLSNINSTVNF